MSSPSAGAAEASLCLMFPVRPDKKQKTLSKKKTCPQLVLSSAGFVLSWFCPQLVLSSAGSVLSRFCPLLVLSGAGSVLGSAAWAELRAVLRCLSASPESNSAF